MQESFKELMNGCHRAKRAMEINEPDVLIDYYDGIELRKKHRSKMIQWDEKTELFVFLSFTSDGFEIFKSSGSISRSFWPTMLNILNLDFCYRYRACNEMICSFIPGSHSPYYFETFIEPIVEDLLRLEEGMEMMCWDGKVRNTICSVLFVTADWLAAKKLCGSMGHNGRHPCRYCSKETSKRYLVPVGDN